MTLIDDIPDINVIFGFQTHFWVYCKSTSNTRTHTTHASAHFEITESELMKNSATTSND